MTRGIRKAGRPARAIRAVLVAAAAMPLALAGAQAADASWVLQKLPLPAGSLGAGLGNVSCTSPASCLALGSSQTKTGATAIAEIWNGTAWTVESIPDTAEVSLFGLSCVTPADCTAAGRNSQSLLPLVEHWDGASWTVQSPLPIPLGDTFGTLTSVSCTSATRCVAVGYAGGGNLAEPFSESWNGTAWTAHTAPLPAFTDGEFRSVSCRSGRSCTAVGEFQVTGGESPLAEAWDGRHWTIQNMPSPSGDNINSLQSVSCRSAARCMAAGFTGTGRAAQGLAEQWNGTTWTILSTPHLGGPNADVTFLSVSCPRAAWCTAVGALTLRTRAKTTPLAEHWTGTRWKVDAIVRPPHSPDTYLGDVSCLARNSCITVGGYQTHQRKQLPLAEQDS